MFLKLPQHHREGLKEKQKTVRVQKVRQGSDAASFGKSKDCKQIITSLADAGSSLLTQSEGRWKAVPFRPQDPQRLRNSSSMGHQSKGPRDSVPESCSKRSGIVSFPPLLCTARWLPGPHSEKKVKLFPLKLSKVTQWTNTQMAILECCLKTVVMALNGWGGRRFMRGGWLMTDHRGKRGQSLRRQAWWEVRGMV